MRKHSLLIGAGVLLMGGGWLAHETHKPQPRGAVAPVIELPAPAASPTSAHVRLPQGAARTPSALSTTATPPVSRTEAETSIQARLDAQVLREGADPEWSRAAEARIGEALRANQMAGTSLLNVDCARSLCRVDVAHTDEETQDQFFQALPLMPPFDTEGFLRRTNTSEHAQTRVYIARVGHTLPRPATM